MGLQPLYTITFELKDETGESIEKRSRRIGLRTLKLERNKDKWGESFRLNVNGMPFFAKGANWIPADAILSRMTPERYQCLVKDAASANMNMLRVWEAGYMKMTHFMMHAMKWVSVYGRILCFHALVTPVSYTHLRAHET